VTPSAREILSLSERKKPQTASIRCNDIIASTQVDQCGHIDQPELDQPELGYDR
jgi:hypothetical protein